MGDAATIQRMKALLALMRERGIGEPPRIATFHGVAPEPEYENPVYSLAETAGNNMRDILLGTPWERRKSRLAAWRSAYHLPEVTPPSASPITADWPSELVPPPERYSADLPIDWEAMGPQAAVDAEVGPAIDRRSALEKLVEQRRLREQAQPQPPAAPAAPQGGSLDLNALGGVLNQFKKGAKALFPFSPSATPAPAPAPAPTQPIEEEPASMEDLVPAAPTQPQAPQGPSPKLLSMLQGIGQGARDIQTTSGAEIRAGVYRPYQDEPEISEDERAWFAEQGIKLPYRMKRADLQKQLPSMVGAMNRQEGYGWRALALANQVRRLGQSDERLILQKEEEERRKMQSERVGTVREKELFTRQDAIDRLDRLLYDFNTDPKFKSLIGPVVNAWNALTRKVGWDNSEVTELRSRIRDMVNTYVTAKTGAARGMQEMYYIKEALPSSGDRPETFEKLIKRWRKEMIREYNSRKKFYEGQGFNTRDMMNYQEDEGVAGSAAAPTAGTVRLRITRKDNGDVREVEATEDQAAQAQEDEDVIVERL